MIAEVTNRVSLYDESTAVVEDASGHVPPPVWTGRGRVYRVCFLVGADQTDPTDEFRLLFTFHAVSVAMVAWVD